MTPADLDARLTAAFGESDPATDAWIAASAAAHRGDLAELDRLSTRLQTGVADYERRLREVERVAGVAR